MKERHRQQVGSQPLQADGNAALRDVELADDEYLAELLRDVSHERDSGNYTTGALAECPTRTGSAQHQPVTNSDLRDLAALEYRGLCKCAEDIHDAEAELLKIAIELAQLIATKRGLTGDDGARVVPRAQATLNRIVTADRARLRHIAAIAELQSAIMGDE